jgi:hypothetical protein
MPIKIADNLYTWTLTLADGSTRTVLGSSMQTVIGGNFPSPVTSAVRGPAFDGTNPSPVLSSLQPATAAIGDPDFTLHVIGTGFGPSDVIVFAGQDEPTTFVSDTELTTGVNMAFWLGADPAIPVFVRALGGIASNVLTFAFTAAARRAHGDEGSRAHHD